MAGNDVYSFNHSCTINSLVLFNTFINVMDTGSYVNYLIKLWIWFDEIELINAGGPRVAGHF